MSSFSFLNIRSSCCGVEWVCIQETRQTCYSQVRQGLGDLINHLETTFSTLTSPLKPQSISNATENSAGSSKSATEAKLPSSPTLCPNFETESHFELRSEKGRPPLHEILSISCFAPHGYRCFLLYNSNSPLIPMTRFTSIATSS